jgi:hypothetical protein
MRGAKASIANGAPHQKHLGKLGVQPIDLVLDSG